MIFNKNTIVLLALASLVDPSIAVTTCEGSNTQLSVAYLEAMSTDGTQANNFVPSAYFLGKATKFVTTEDGLTVIDDPQICVDGKTESETIELFDDGTHGDDIAGDGVYSRSCVHFCEATVNFEDVWGFAMEKNDAAGAARLIVVDPSLEGEIPAEILPTPPQYPGATIVATSHAAFYVDTNREYFPGWPNNVGYDGGRNLDAPNGRSTAIGSILAVFGDVFDFLTISGLEENGALQGAGIYKWQQWETSGAPLPNEGIGDAEECTMAVTGVPVTRLTGVISAKDSLNPISMNHELVHGVSGYSYHENMGERAIQGDNSHTPGTCTVDHSYLQGPIWDWEKGFPFALPMSYCDPSEECVAAAGDLVRLEPNPECNDCPEDDLSNCCTFQLVDVIGTSEDMEARPDLITMTPLMSYIAGFLPFEEIPEDDKTFYCIGTNADFGCGTEDSGIPCQLEVDETNRSRATANLVIRFTVDDLVAANGPRFPLRRAVPTLRHGVVYISPREPSEAERTFYTMFWRHWEVENSVHDRVPDLNGGRKLPLSTWSFHTQGLSKLHSRLHGIACGGGLNPPSCRDPQDSSVCENTSCSPGAYCVPFDNLPLCICRDGLVGDGTLCVEPSETVRYPLPTAHELFSRSQDRCFGNGWPGRVEESSLPAYPGGISPFSVGSSPPSDPTPTPAPTMDPTAIVTAAPTMNPSVVVTPAPTMNPTTAITPDPVTDGPTTVPKVSPPTATPTLSDPVPNTSSPTATPTSSPDELPDDDGIPCYDEICPPGGGWFCNEIPSYYRECTTNKGKRGAIYHRIKDGECEEKCRTRSKKKWFVGTCDTGECAREV